MPYLTALALLGSLLVAASPRRLLSPVAEDPVWEAALAGGLTAGVVGALVEDSGPLLFVVAVVALGCVLAYLWGRPVPAAQRSGACPQPAPAAASGAVRHTRGLAPSARSVVYELVERRQRRVPGVAKPFQAEQVLDAAQQREVVVEAEFVDAASLDVGRDQQQADPASAPRR